MRNFMKLFLRPIYLYWLTLILLLLIFTFAVPPFQKPDESLHFYRAFSLFFNKTKAQQEYQEKNRYVNQWYDQLPQSVTDFPDKMLTNTILMRYDLKFPISLYKIKYTWIHDNTIARAYSNSVFLLPAQSYFVYLPAIIISRIFDNLLITFYLMRFSTAMLYILVVFLGFRILPKRYLWLFGFFSLTPMVLHQVSAISYDSPSLIFGLLLFALFLYLMEKKRISWLNLITLIIVLVVFNVMKGGYYATGLLIIPILLKMFANKRQVLVSIAIFLAMWVVALIFYNFVVLSFSNLISHNYQFQLYYLYPDYTFRFLVHSIFSEQVFWIQGLVGTFGWLDYSTPLIFTVFYYFLLGAVTIHLVQHDKPKMSFLIALLMVFIPVATCLTVIYYVSFFGTNAGYPNVMSVQGRYFLICVPLFIYGLSQLYVNRPRFIKICFVFFSSVLFVVLIVSMIYYRYYDFSKTYSNGVDLQKRIENEEVFISSNNFTISASSSFVLSSSVGKKINGFQLLTAPSDVPVDIPYRYRISDETCTKSFAEGIINPFIIGKQGIATVNIRPFLNTKEKICLIISPAVPVVYTQGYWQIKTDQNNVPIYQFLYIPQ